MCKVFGTGYKDILGGIGMVGCVGWGKVWDGKM